MRALGRRSSALEGARTWAGLLKLTSGAAAAAVAALPQMARRLAQPSMGVADAGVHAGPETTFEAPFHKAKEATTLPTTTLMACDENCYLRRSF